MTDIVWLVTGGGGAMVGGYVAVIAANKTNIEWLKAEVKRLGRQVEVLHSRIDKILEGR